MTPNDRPKPKKRKKPAGTPIEAPKAQVHMTSPEEYGAKDRLPNVVADMQEKPGLTIRFKAAGLFQGMPVEILSGDPVLPSANPPDVYAVFTGKEILDYFRAGGRYFPDNESIVAGLAVIAKIKHHCPGVEYVEFRREMPS